MNNLFNNYHEWRKTMTERAGLTLDRSYCEDRLAILEDQNNNETQSFIKAFGPNYHQQVIAWFHQALSEA